MGQLAGEAPMDLWVVDIRGFSGLHTRSRLGVRAHLEAYGKHYTDRLSARGVCFAAGRASSRPLYDRLKARGASSARSLAGNGPTGLRPAGMQPRDAYSMGRQNWFDAVGEEHQGRARGVGLFDQSSFAKYELSGPGAAKALDWICANHVTKSGRAV
jgi:sarcosine dehydrogenase